MEEDISEDRNPVVDADKEDVATVSPVDGVDDGVEGTEEVDSGARLRGGWVCPLQRTGPLD